MDSHSHGGGVAKQADTTEKASDVPAKPWQDQELREGKSGQAVDSTLNFPADQILREDQIQSAVSFLSHPKVKSSTTESKRAFLQKKGLTTLEIDEAFNRVSKDNVFPSASSPSGQQPNAVLQQQKPAHITQPQPLRFSQVVLGGGLAVLCFMGVRRLLEPYRCQILRTLSRAIAPREDCAAEEPPAASESALQRSVSSLEGSAAKLCSAVEALTAKVEALSQAPRPPADGTAALGAETIAELRSAAGSLAEALKGAERGVPSPAPLPGSVGWGAAPSQALQRPPAAGVWGGVPLPTTEESRHRPPAAMGSSRPPITPVDDRGKAPMSGDAKPSYKEVVEMLKNGKEPPGIRKDINDEPPDPQVPPSSSQMPVRPKPWERSSATAPPPMAPWPPAARPNAVSEPPPQGPAQDLPAPAETGPSAVFPAAAGLPGPPAGPSQSGAVPAGDSWKPLPRPKPMLPPRERPSGGQPAAAAGSCEPTAGDPEAPPADDSKAAGAEGEDAGEDAARDESSCQQGPELDPAAEGGASVGESA
uniref:Peroxisomal membrane protein PEX14 n=1 Tax=Tetraselmis sp. GSL018 TaxID=582737 RepID=A0A061S114_9CHLO